MPRDNESAGQNSSDQDIQSWAWHRGPAGWYRFRCPDHIGVRVVDGCTELFSKMDAADLTSEWFGSGLKTSSSERLPVLHSSKTPPLLISVAWDDNSEEAAVREECAFGSLFPGIIFSVPVESVPGNSERRVWSGVSRRTVSRSWWKRMFLPGPVYHWRFWEIVCGPLRIVASLQSEPGTSLDSDYVRLLDRIMATLEPSAAPIWPPERFRREVVSLAAGHFPLAEIQSTGQFSVLVAGSKLNLENFYRSYLRDPTGFQSIVLTGVGALIRLQELSPEQLLPRFDQVADRIFPMLIPEGREDSEELVCDPWVASLSIGYVIDDSTAYRFVSQAALQNWQLSADQLHDLAVRNLRRYAEEYPLEATLLGDPEHPRLLMPAQPDAYHCVRILDPGFHARLRQLFGPEFVVGVPNRDFFVAVSLRNPELIRQVRERVAADHSTMHHPLTSRLLVVSADGVSEYCDDSAGSADA